MRTRVFGVVNGKRGGEVRKKETLTGRVSYRLGGEAMRQIEKLAVGQGLTPNEWCRQVVLEKLAERKRPQAAPAQPTGQSAPAPPPSPPAPAQSLGPIMNQNQAIFEEVLRLKFLIRQLAMRYVEGNLTGQGWNFIDINTDGNMFREVAAKWAERYGLKIRY